MGTNLSAWINARIDEDATLPDTVGLLILAALENDDELDAYLDGRATTPDDRHDQCDDPASASGGTFLKSLTVAGFRGVGQRVRIDFRPAPGLTIIAGRNGSGKSSLAEALEVLLTGETYRWKRKSGQWVEHWRNLHNQSDTEVIAEFVQEGSGQTAMRATWPPDASRVDAAVVRVQRTVDGKKQPEQDAATLGWSAALETYRPLLSYDELGGLLEAGPSELYDALAKVLGTEQLAEALKRIQARAKALKQPGTALNTIRRELADSAARLSDDRGDAVAPLLKKTKPDPVAIRALATGVRLPDAGLLSSLRALAALDAPDPKDVRAATATVRDAVSEIARLGETELKRRIMRVDLRRSAVQLHEEFGDQICPVCARAHLDDAWAETAKAFLAGEDAELNEIRTAQANLETARSGLKHRLPRRPMHLDRRLDDGRVDISLAQAAWDEYLRVPEGDLAACDHLDSQIAALADAVAELRSQATAALATLDDAWGPLAGRIAAWCDEWEEWVTAQPQIELLTTAEKWLKENDTRLKNERISPISDQARHAWSVLRQESNVDLGDLRLEGSATRRHVAISASVDGEDAGALAVMSQGELHALSLALFLPRATLPESPFRFVILDDPIQAMDPAKVEGFVSLLEEMALDRQVIVFSHDDRLPAALRRSKSPVRILEVVRGEDSAIEIRNATDPTSRYLNDASALVRDIGVPEETMRLTLPSLIRFAIESAAHEVFFARRLSRGEALAEVEDRWNAAHRTAERVSLAVNDEVRSLDGWLRTESRKAALGIASTAAHEGLRASTDPDDAIHHARRVVDELREGAK